MHGVWQAFTAFSALAEHFGEDDGAKCKCGGCPPWTAEYAHASTRAHCTHTPPVGVPG